MLKYVDTKVTFSEVPDDENLYNSYFYNAHDDTSVLDKFILHGRQTYQYTDGRLKTAC